MEQVERWLRFKDKVTPEMQDRIQTSLERPLEELFSENKPSKSSDDAKPLWGSGLRPALRGMDEKSLAELLDEQDVERVRKWIKQQLNVSPIMQWRLVRVLNERHEVLFPPADQNRDAWAIKLRAALDRRRGDLTPKKLADQLGVTLEQIYRWMELEEPASFACQTKIIKALKVTGDEDLDIFAYGQLQDFDFRRAKGLGSHLTDKGKTREMLADHLMISVSYVRQWIEEDKAVAQPTQTWIANFLDWPEKELDKLFPPTG